MALRMAAAAGEADVDVLFGSPSLLTGEVDEDNAVGGCQRWLHDAAGPQPVHSDDVDPEKHLSAIPINEAMNVATVRAINALENPTGDYTEFQRATMQTSLRSAQSTHAAIRKVLGWGEEDPMSVDALALARLPLESLYIMCMFTETPEWVDVYVRDDDLDTGERLPSPSGIQDPLIPAPGTANFWMSPDIKVRRPSLPMPPMGTPPNFFDFAFFVGDYVDSNDTETADVTGTKLDKSKPE